MGQEKLTWWGEEPKNIVVRMPNWLGDFVMATPILQDLRSRFPDSAITALCLSHFSDLLSSSPFIDRVLPFDKSSCKRSLIRSIGVERYDCGLLLTNSLSSAWWFWRAGVRNRLGYRGHFRRYLLSKAEPLPKDYQQEHLVLTYKRLLTPLGISLSHSLPKIYIAEQDRLFAEKTIAHCSDSSDQIFIGINPGAAYGSAKCWPKERFRELTMRLLKQPNYRILFFGDRAGAPLVDAICSKMPERVVNMAGKTTIGQLASLIERCHVLLTNDSGPMHMAAALNVAPLALFGSTSDRRTGPYGIGSVIHKRVECSPCYRRKCPIDFRCMKRIKVDEVFTNLEKMIGE